MSDVEPAAAVDTVLESRDESPEEARDNPAPREDESADRGGIGRAEVERIAPWLAGALLALPVLVSAYPPMTDLPLHEVTVAILRHFDDASMFPPGLYFVNLGHPNQLFHALALLLSFAFGTTAACKVVVAASIMATPVAAARLASHLGASRWSAVVVAPVAVGWLFFTGLVANMLGLALLLALMPALDRFIRRPTTRGAIAAIGGAVLLYFAHEAMMFLYAAAALLFTVGYPLRMRATAARLSVFAASVAITGAQLVYQAPLYTASTKKIPTVFLPLSLKAGGLPGVLYGGYDQGESRLLLALSCAVILLLGAQRWREHKEEGTPVWRGLGLFLRDYRFEIFAACCFAAYVAYPVTLNGATLVYHRFLAPAFALAAITASPRVSRARGLDAHDADGDADDENDGTTRAPSVHRLTAFLAGTVPVAALLIVWPAFAESSRNYRDVQKLVPFIAKGSSIAAVAGSVSHDPGFVRPTMAIHAVTERGGRMLYSFSESPIAPVMIRPEYEWAEPIARILPNEHQLCPSYDFTRFRYLLFHTTDPELEYIVSQALKPEARLVEVAGDWALFESSLPTVPLKSPDVQPPKPCAMGTLGSRMQRTTAALRALVGTGAKGGAAGNEGSEGHGAETAPEDARKATPEIAPTVPPVAH